MKYYYAAMRYLKSKLQADLPIKVRRMKLPCDIYGDCSKHKDYYLIRISNKLSWQAAIDILIHEMAHALSWNKENNSDHGPAWGASFAKCYRTYQKLNEFVD